MFRPEARVGSGSTAAEPEVLAGSDVDSGGVKTRWHTGEELRVCIPGPGISCGTVTLEIGRVTPTVPLEEDEEEAAGNCTAATSSSETWTGTGPGALEEEEEDDAHSGIPP